MNGTVLNGLPSNPTSESSQGTQNGVGGPSFEMISPSSSEGQFNGDLGFLNPMGLGQISLTDVTLEQALEKVQKLMEENRELREYLKKNNDMMRDQYKVVAQWKEKIRESNVQYKQKFEETRNVILNLRKDNEELQLKLEESENKQADVSSTLTSRIRELETTTTELKNELKLHATSSQQTTGSSVEGSPDMVQKDKGKQLKQEDIIKELMSQLQITKEQENKSKTDQEHWKKIAVDLKADKDKYCSENADLSQKIQSLLYELNSVKHECAFLKTELAGVNKRNEGLSLKHGSESSSNMSGNSFVGSPPSGAMSGESWESPPSFVREDVQRLGTPVHVGKSQSPVNIVKGQSPVNMAFGQSPDGKDRSFLELQRQLSQKDSLIEMLQKEIQEHRNKPTTPSSDVQALMSQNLTLISEITDANNKLEAAKQAIDQKTNRLVEAEQALRKYQEETEKQRHEDNTTMQSLQMLHSQCDAALQAERKEHQASKQQVANLRQTVNNVMADYKELLKNFETYKTQEKSRSQKESPDRQKYLEEVSHLTARMLAAEEAINYRDQQIKKMKEENDKLKEEVQTIPVHMAQADLWKIDFEAERRAREEQHMDMEALKQEINNLNLQNQQIREEFDAYSRGQLAEMQKKHATGGFQGSHHQQMQNYLQVVPPSPPGQDPAPHRARHTYVNQMPEARSGQMFGPPTPCGQAQVPLTYPHPNQHATNKSPPQAYHNINQVRRDASSGSSEEEYHPLCCPKCNLQCPDVDTLQIHVLECIDQN